MPIALNASNFRAALSEGNPELADRYVTGWLDTAVDEIQSGTREDLSTETAQAGHLHRDLEFQLGQDTKADAAYFAGRLASLADLLGFARERRTTATFDETLQRPEFGSLLRSLNGTSLDSDALATKTGESVEELDRKLAKLIDAGAIVAFRRGISNTYQLTPAASAYARSLLPTVEAGDVSTLAQVIQGYTGRSANDCTEDDLANLIAGVLKHANRHDLDADDILDRATRAVADEHPAPRP